MNIDNEVFLKKLFATFLQEAKEHIDNLSNGLLELNTSNDIVASKEIIETLFREAHSFKGASRSVNIPEIEEICKAMEDVFSHYKHSQKMIPNSLIEVMLESNDFLTLLLHSDELGRRDQKPHVQKVIDNLHKKLNIENQNQSESQTKIIIETPLTSILPNIEMVSKDVDEVVRINEELRIKDDTLRISVKKLNNIMQHCEDMLYAKISSKRYLHQLKEIIKEFDELKKRSVNLNAKKVNNIEQLLKQTIKQVKGDTREIELSVDGLLREMKEALILPFSTFFYTLPKIVHDLAKSQDKETLFNIIGGDIEIDRRILEEMHDPLIHLLRNAIDHGIENREIRISKGKNPVGMITLSLHQISATKVEIKVFDDGEGINPFKVVEKAVKKGILNSEFAKTLDTEGMINLIFLSGVTTAKQVTNLSGRGLGLAIVEEKAQKLGGYVKVENQPKGGSEFSITLPLSMATFRGVVTLENNQIFIFPSENIVRVLSMQLSEVKNIEGKEIIQIDHHIVPFFYLSTLLELPFTPYSTFSVIVLSYRNSMMAVAVKEIKSEEELMVKSLGKQLLCIKNISGVTSLSSDITGLILNVSDLFKSIRNISYKHIAVNRDNLEKKRRILVVDDSPTTRALLQNILEMVGYYVGVAVDGLDGYEKLKNDSFDLVVCDVDMPRMSGFELTKAIRFDSQLSETPIILVTSLEQEEDREKGMSLGASAYIIKSTFDQNNLLENIELLI